jgi:hypothetical protein
VAKLELSRQLSLSPDDAWAHASNLADLGDWLVMHQGWRGRRRCQGPAQSGYLDGAEN